MLVHVAVVLGFPPAPTSEPAVASEETGLVWLERDASEGVTTGDRLTRGEPASASPAEVSRSSARGVALASMATARLAAPTSEASSEANATSVIATAGTQSLRASPTGLGASGAAEGDGAADGAGMTAATAGSGRGGDTAGAPARGPRLVSAANPCAGYFPAGAHAAHGRVQVEVEVGANGRIASTRVMAEQPLGEGFAGAARACADRLLFTPAHTSQGTPVEGHARLLLSFDRS